MSARQHLRAVSWLLNIVLCLGLLCAAPAAAKRSPQASAAEAASELRSVGIRQLARGELDQAARSIEASYRLKPDASGLYLLCSLAWAEGRTRAAQDLARRYLAEEDGLPLTGKRATPGREPSRLASPSRSEAQRIVGLPGEPGGELIVLGPAGAWVLLDERLAGRLPLSRPLWVTAGAHQVVVETGPERQVIAAQAQVAAGRTLELRIQPATGAALLTRVPSMIVLIRKSAVPADTELRIAQAISAVAQRAHLAIPGAEPAFAQSEPGADCQDSVACLDALAHRSEAAYVLDVRVSGPAERVSQTKLEQASWSLTLRLLSGLTGELALAGNVDCASCSAERAAALVEQALTSALKIAETRPYSQLALRSEPAGAEVWIDGYRMGTTPYQRAAWTGRKRLELRRDGHVTWTEEVQIEESKPTTLSIKLQPKPQVALAGTESASPSAGAAARPAHIESDPRTLVPRPRAVRVRPRWRLITGGLAVAGGLVLAGFGASALAINGSCSSDTPASAVECRSSYDAAPVGGALLGVGGALVIAGGVLVLLPGATAQKQPQL